MNTRTERIGNILYCAYCGKVLKSYNCFGVDPELPLICNCEKAKEELDLYKKLKSLYSSPLAESLIDKKLEKYRNELLGIKDCTYVDGIDSPYTVLASKTVIDHIDQNDIDSVFDVTGVNV